MVKHQPLQFYEPQLCLSCLTGSYGCRWKRYQRSHDDTTKWECLWFLVLCVTFSLTLIWCYFWWEVHNDYNEFNWYMYNRNGYWSDCSVAVLTLAFISLTYTSLLLILALGHIAVGQQLNIHWIHKVGVSVALGWTLVALLIVREMWSEEWEVLLISLQATAPFLHIMGLVGATGLSWLVAGQFAQAEKLVFQIVLLLSYLSLLIALYLVPLSIYSPCFMEKKNLGQKPTIIGNRGAPMLAPENTLMSFHRAAEHRVGGFYTDVQISYDGVPFLMRDQTLRRTTDVEGVFPERQWDRADMFNWTDLQSLSAGIWFIQADPYGSVDSLSTADLSQAGNQTVCSLSSLLSFAAETNISVMFSLRRPPPAHPHHNNWVNLTLNTILLSRLTPRLVMWLPDEGRGLVDQVAPEFLQVSASPAKLNVSDPSQHNIRTVSLRYTQLTPTLTRQYVTWNISVNVFVVNVQWLYSLLWCAGVQSVTSDSCQTLSRAGSPSWILPQEEYSGIWITSDIISVTVVLAVFILQNYHMIRWRLGNMKSYNPEQIMLSAAVRRTSRELNIMKEKLIFAEINNGVSSCDDGSFGSDSGFDGYSNQAIGPRNENKSLQD